MPQLNFQQSEYQTGRLAQFEVVNCPPDRQRAVSGVVQEWISHELGLARLEDGGVAIFAFHEISFAPGMISATSSVVIA